ncbi:putative quinol monooxygenase [Spongiactinospora sp. 9N601]|uniref:putative quinol monooxygenase n=1 Tax=Spongiactinospora sp. 9N601 TaxID=3375149 RepID=UPI00379251C0
MENVVAVIGFAGALLAAIATGALIRRLRDEPVGWLGAWTASTAALCLALGVVAAGHLLGFGATTFRLYQITGSLVAPLWLAIGAVQLLARKTPPKFAAWLLGGALTFVSIVIMVVDPVNNGGSFSESLPVGSAHWSLFPASLLAAAHAATVAIMVGAVIVAGLRWRDGDEYDLDNMHAVLVIGPVGIALVGVLRFSSLGLFTTVILTVGAAATWYALIRPLAPYDDEEDEEEDGYEEDTAAVKRPEQGRRRAVAEQGVQARDQVRETIREPTREPIHEPARSRTDQAFAEQGRMEERGRREGHGFAAEGGVPESGQPQPQQGRRRSGLGDLVAEYRAGEQDVDYAARMRADEGGSPFAEPSYGDASSYGEAPPFEEPSANGFFGGPAGGATGDFESPRAGRGRRGTETGAHARMEGGGGGRRARRAEQQDYSMPGTGVVYPETSGHGPNTGGGGGGRPSPSIYGLLTVFTLIDGSGDAFDHLAEATVDGVRQNEPDTLVYSCHAVKSAPLQRIVYELYRDEVAFAEHQRQPHVQRFVTERQSLVLATNVIELTVNAAKVVPLPTAFI